MTQQPRIKQIEIKRCLPSTEDAGGEAGDGEEGTRAGPGALLPPSVPELLGSDVRLSGTSDDVFLLK